MSRLNHTERAVMRRCHRALQLVDKITDEVDQKLSDRFLETASELEIAKVLRPIMENFTLNILANIYPLGHQMMAEDLRVLALLEEGREAKDGSAHLLAPEEREGWVRGPTDHFDMPATSMDGMLDQSFAALKEKFLADIERFNRTGLANQFSAFADIHMKGEGGHHIKLTVDFWPNPLITGKDITGANG